MLNEESILDLLAEHYGARPVALHSLQHYSFDWRGIYRADHADGSAWVVRLVRLPGAAGTFSGTAALLGWLRSRGYPAPLPIPTSAGASIAQAGDWSVQAISYIAGAPARVQPDQLRAIGAALGRLHTLALPAADRPPYLPDSQWPRGEIGRLRQQLSGAAPRAGPLSCSRSTAAWSPHWRHWPR
jgi:Ser/Thr protein kinase RdoA (MazF antagonist)